MKFKMQKISANFEVQLAGIDSCERRDAIVIYQPTDSAQAIGRNSGKRMNFDQKRKYLNEFASRQAPMQINSLSTYMKEGKTRLPKNDRRDLVAKSIGQVAGALPFAHVQVTKRTLAALRRADEVLAVIPNQPINLIKPRATDYGTLIHAERSSGMTWGLERLNIPQLWSRSGTRGENIRVAVLDTGVYDQHPALIGKVSEFVVVDPLGNRVNTATRFDAGNHGTHVCGTVAGDQDPNGVKIGVAPAAKLLVGAVLLGNATLLTLIEGIAWAVQQGADIISMSLGFSYYEPRFELIFKQ